LEYFAPPGRILFTPV